MFCNRREQGFLFERERRNTGKTEAMATPVSKGWPEVCHAAWKYTQLERSNSSCSYGTTSTGWFPPRPKECYLRGCDLLPDALDTLRSFRSILRSGFRFPLKGAGEPQARPQSPGACEGWVAAHPLGTGTNVWYLAKLPTSSWNEIWVWNHRLQKTI